MVLVTSLVCQPVSLNIAVAKPTDTLHATETQEIDDLETTLTREHGSTVSRLATLEQELYLYDDAVILRELGCHKQSISSLKRELSVEKAHTKRLRRELQTGQEGFVDVSQLEKSLLLSTESEWLEERLSELQFGNWEMAKRIMNQADGILPRAVLESTMWEVLSEEELEQAISFIRQQRERVDRFRMEKKLVEDAAFQLQKERLRAELLDSMSPEELAIFYASQLETARRRLKAGLEGEGLLNEVNLRVAYRRLEEIDAMAPEDFISRDETKILLALAAVELNRFEKAEEVLAALIDVIQPDNPLYSIVILQEMQLAFASRKYPPVVDLGKRLLQRPDIGRSTENRARYLAGLSAYLSGLPSDGKEILEGIKGKNSYYFYSRFYMALHDAEMGEFRVAADRLLALLEKLPKTRNTYDLENRTTLALAYIYFEMGEPGTAFRLFQDIPAGTPFEIAASYGTAWCLIALEHFDEAENQLHYCRKVGVGTLIEFEAIFTLVELYIDQRRFEESRIECLALKDQLIELTGGIGSFGVSKEMQLITELRDETAEFSQRIDSDRIQEKMDEAVRALNQIDSELYALTARLGGEIDPAILLCRTDRLLAEIELARLAALREELGMITAEGSSTHGTRP